MKKMFLAVLLMIAVPAFAGAAERFPEKTWELGLFSDSEGGVPFPFIGYFFQDNLEGVVHFAYSSDKSDVNQGNDLENKSMALEFGLLYNVPTTSNVVPLIGGFIQYVDTESTLGNVTDDISGYILEGDIGARFMVTPRSSVNVKLSVVLGDFDLKSGTTSASADVTGFSFGLGYSLFF